MIYLISIILTSIMLCQTVFSQDVVAFRKACCFSKDGSSYFISEATFDKSKSIFPFKFAIKEISLSGDVVRTIKIGTDGLIGIDNDSVNYHFVYSDSSDSCFLYKTVGTDKNLIARLPYSFDYLNSIGDFRARDQTLYLLHREHPKYLFKIDLTKTEFITQEIGFLEGLIRDNRVSSISSEDGIIFSIDYKSEEGKKGTYIVDLFSKRLRENLVYDKNISQVVSKIVGGKLFSVIGYLSNEEGVERGKSLLKVSDLKTQKIIKSKDFEIDGLPETMDVYDHGDKTRILLTYAQRKATVGTQLTNEEFNATLNFQSYEVKLITIDNL